MVINEKYTHTFSFSQNDVIDFAKVTGDNNPIHLDEKMASKSIFKKRIIHGFLAGSVFSKVFGTLWPGKGTIYLDQSLKFKRPMFIDTEYIANFEVLEIDDRNRAKIKTNIIDNKSGNIVIDGLAFIIYPTE